MEEESSIQVFLQDFYRRSLAGWSFSLSVYAHGVMLAYVVFASIFGPIYSISTLISLAVNGLTQFLPLASLLLRIYIISFFAIPLGFAFKVLQRGRTDESVRVILAGVLIFDAAVAIFGYINDSGVILSVLAFTAILLALLFREAKEARPTEETPFGILKVFLLLYCVYFPSLILLARPNLNILTMGQLYNLLLNTTLGAQLVSVPLALVTTPIGMALAHKEKPRATWFAFFSLFLFSILSVALGFYLESIFFILTSALLFYRYGTEAVLPTRVLPRVAAAERMARSTAGTAEGDSWALIARSLEKLTREVEDFKEARTGEALRVRTIDDYVPEIVRTVAFMGERRDVGVNHYLISSRTGHGKTTLVRNLISYYTDVGFLIMDRHNEYTGKVVTLDKEFNLEDVERVVDELPSASLGGGRNILREAQIYNLEQQISRLLDSAIQSKFVAQTYDYLLSGGKVILRPGGTSEEVYTMVAHRVIDDLFIRCKHLKEEPETLSFVVINEEAQNSFEVAEDGRDYTRNHPLLRLINEGRKYGVSLVNISSDPDNIPKTVKDNSVLTLGSIGTPAIRRLVGEKLGMVYVRFIYELPIGSFFMDIVDDEGNYIAFPNHFSQQEFMNALRQ